MRGAQRGLTFKRRWVVQKIFIGMESKKLKTLQLLEVIAADQPTSQRELSDRLHISLGLVNAYIKRLVNKGHCKVTTIPKKRAKYILTPAGEIEKTRLTYQYISRSYQYFQSAQDRLQGLYTELQSQGKTRVVFYGAGEIADIAYLAITGLPLQLVGVVDPKRAGSRFADFEVHASLRHSNEQYDALLITVVDNHPTIVHNLKAVGVPPGKIRFFG